jgi:hypothetical protein
MKELGVVIGKGGHRDRTWFDWVVYTKCKSFELAVTWTKERIHIYYQNIKFNNLYVL